MQCIVDAVVIDRNASICMIFCVGRSALCPLEDSVELMMLGPHCC